MLYDLASCPHSWASAGRDRKGQESSTKETSVFLQKRLVLFLVVRTNHAIWKHSTKQTQQVYPLALQLLRHLQQCATLTLRPMVLLHQLWNIKGLFVTSRIRCAYGLCNSHDNNGRTFLLQWFRILKLIALTLPVSAPDLRNSQVASSIPTFRCAVKNQSKHSPVELSSMWTLEDERGVVVTSPGCAYGHGLCNSHDNSHGLCNSHDNNGRTLLLHCSHN